MPKQYWPLFCNLMYLGSRFSDGVEQYSLRSRIAEGKPVLQWVNTQHRFSRYGGGPLARLGGAQSATTALSKADPSLPEIVRVGMFDFASVSQKSSFGSCGTNQGLWGHCS
jgi:hypothetical protein